MKERILDKTILQVRHNCRISDAQFWGYYTVCGLLLRLRELYRFEKGLGPTDPTDMDDITRWIGEREEHWEELSHMEFAPIEVEGRSFESFDVEGINRVLTPHGLLYGAGYGVYMKPVFFLADLDAEETLQGLRVLFAGTEYARDLSIHPAMLQGKTVLARRDAALVLTGEKFEEFRASKHNSALDIAFTSYGVTPEASEAELQRVAVEELRTYVYHEIGEALEEERSAGLWAEMLVCSTQRKACQFLRGLKDVLADTTSGGMLSHIIENRKAGSLAFYISMLSGYRKILSADIEEAFKSFPETQRWEDIEAARDACYQKTSALAEDLLSGFRLTKDPEELERSIETLISRISQ